MTTYFFFFFNDNIFLCADENHWGKANLVRQEMGKN